VGNFVCVNVKADGNQVYEALLKKGVIVRPVGPYQMPEHIRVSVGTKAENETFLTALKSVLQEMGIQ
ncbi:MAG TPA: histidinol-phosphate transaminase, partial [Gammaproteobacteria bacterium]|nr:histidinol-phosphate transaminase [Gammaproteobacteria bacterium]